MSDQVPVSVKARLAYASAAREVSDYARGLVGDTATPMLPGERIRAARRLRVAAATALDRAVLIELVDGTSWLEVADSLGLSEQTTRDRYGPTVTRWLQDQPPAIDLAVYGDFTTGMTVDPDPAGTAASIDAWYRRHAEPWEQPESQPVSRALL